MRRLLIWIVVLEGVALAAAGGTLLFGIEDRARPAPRAPVFVPPIYDGVIGEFVRYQKLDRESGAVLGYLDYRRRRGGFGPALTPSGDLKRDMDQIRRFYADKTGRYPECFGDVRLREESDAELGALLPSILDRAFKRESADG